jgi:predicted RNase H-like nuclease (RuvC/YqgF family)
MLSHITGASERTRREELNNYVRQIEKLSESKDLYKKKLADSNTRLKALKKENGVLRKSEQQLEQRCCSLQNEVDSFRSGADNSPKMEELKSKLRGMELQYERARQVYNSLAEELEELHEYNAMLQELLTNAYRKRCEDCENACEYAGTVNLNRKTVLLVGGRTSSIPRYRSLIEIMNGTFVHHDGGQEESMSVLQNLVPKADIIVCFLNCVSHGASKYVKSTCRCEKQRIIMLKTSGLNTFKKELEKRAG